MCISFRTSGARALVLAMVRAPNPRGNRCFSCIGMIRPHKKSCCKCTTCDCWINGLAMIGFMLYWMCVFVLSGVFTSFALSISKKHAGGRNRGTFFPTNHTLPSTEADVRCGHWWYLRNVGGGELPSPTHPTDVTPLSCDPTFRDSWKVVVTFEFKVPNQPFLQKLRKQMVFLVKYMVQIVQNEFSSCCCRTFWLFCQRKQEKCLLNVIDFVSVYVWMIEVQLWVKNIIFFWFSNYRHPSYEMKNPAKSFAHPSTLNHIVGSS